MSKMFPNLFSPTEIRGKRLKNRLFLAAHGTGLAEDGKVGGAGYEYYKARVTRGIGLLITEATQVVPTPGQKYAQLNVSSDTCIPGLKSIADLCHENDCLYFVQLFHPGRGNGHSMDGSRPMSIAPSELPEERYHNMPRTMTVPMIRDLVTEFGKGAARAHRAGVDGVEILAGMGYLFAEFLSPRANIRTDAYGGSLEGRTRFLRETLAAMRASTSEDFILGVRISGEESSVDGIELEDTLEICRLLEHEGLVDFVNVCVAGAQSLNGSSLIVPPMSVETGYTLPYAQAVKEVVSVPVLTCGRINQPQDAERAITSGQTDVVGVVRALIADPEFVEKSREDRPDDIRACIACNQACIGHRLTGYGISCIQYPETGRETQRELFRSATVKKAVTIVGGGPAGMKAAVVAARRGHRITLFEKSGRLGGQALLAQALPGRAEFGGLISNLEHELERHGVAVKKNTQVTAEMVLATNPDAVVVATGAVPRMPSGEFEEANCVSAWDVINGRVKVGARVVIADWRCDWIGLGVAEKLASEGSVVTLCVNGEMAGQTIQRYVRYRWIGRLHDLGVDVVPYVRLFGADSDTVYMQHIMTGEPVMFEGVDTLVYATGHTAVADLFTDLDGKVNALYAAGDCMSPRTAEEAILEGLKVASEI